MATASARSLPALMYSIEGGTPTEIIEKLNSEFDTALSDSKMKARLADLGSTVLPGSPADFGKLIAEDTEKGAQVRGDQGGLISGGRSGSDRAIELRGRHGGTCFDCGGGRGVGAIDGPPTLCFKGN